MNSEDYKQKRHECWEEFKRTNLDGEVQWQPVSRYDIFCAAFDRAFALGKQDAQLLNNPKQLDTVETVIQGWVARDSNLDLFIYNDKPKRDTRWDDIGIWNGKYITELTSSLFPDLTWESDPQPVEIIIKRKKK